MKFTPFRRPRFDMGAAIVELSRLDEFRSPGSHC